jgi:hypothetical protein
MALEAVPPTVLTLLEVKDTQQLKLNPFTFLEFGAMTPAKCSTECFVNGVVDIRLAPMRIS